MPFASVQKAWHGLGKLVDKAMTSEEAIQEAGLNWEVEKLPNYVRVGEEFKKSPNSFSTVRTDTGEILGGRLFESYALIQNREVFVPFNDLFKEEAHIETAGSLFGGRKVFMTAKIPSYIRVNGSDDLIEKYLFFTTSHDGSGSVIGAITPVRIVCNNTLNASLNECSNKISIRHNIHEKGSLSRITELMGVVNQYTLEIEEVFSAIVRKPHTDEQVKKLVYNVFAPDRQVVNPDEFSTRLVNLTLALI